VQVPSTVDVFINDRLATRQDVPPGPFVIDRLPVVTGAGEMQVVVRDALGRERTHVSSFYSAPTLLAPGIAQYSIDVGKVRQDFTLQSNAYGDWVGAATYRRGVADWLTLEGHGTVLQHGAYAAGIDAAMRAGNAGVLSAAVARGGDDTDSGLMAALGFERSARPFSFAVRGEFADAAFRHAGARWNAPPSSQLIARVGVEVGRLGSLAAAYGQACYRDGTTRRTVTLTHAMALAGGHLSVVAHRSWARDAATSVSAMYTLPFERRRSASISGHSRPDGSGEWVSTVQQSTPVGYGLGYRASASSGGNYDARVSRHFQHAAVELQASKIGGARGERLTVSGAVTALGGDIYLSRAIGGSFVLVEAPDLPSTTIYVENQPAALTNAQGRVLLRNMRPYERNRIGVNPNELPLEVRVRTASIEVAPAYRSGAVVRLPVERERGAVLTLVLPGGTPVPSGARVELGGRGFHVALDGFTYVVADTAAAAGTGLVSWNGKQCAFELPALTREDLLPDLGEVVCAGSGGL
jgi:outer membrane usher protein